MTTFSKEVEILAREMCQAQGTRPDELVFIGQLQAGPRGSIVVPDADATNPAWHLLAWDVARGLRALKAAGYVIAAPADDKAA